MDIVGLIHDSLGFSFGVLENLVSDLTQEQADWMPPGKANPIASHYWHAIAFTDQVVHEWGMPPFLELTQEEWAAAKIENQDLRMGQVPLRLRDGWQEKVVIALHPENPADPYWEVRASREGPRVNLLALHDYARATTESTLAWAAALELEDLERPIPTPIGDYSLGHFLEVFVVSHLDNHCGEIATLKGCLGLQGYPW
jgi:hypothetical protein